MAQEVEFHFVDMATVVTDREVFEQVRFLRHHLDRILPLCTTDIGTTLKDISASPSVFRDSIFDKISKGVLAEALRIQRTEIYTYSNQAASEDGKHILFSVTDNAGSVVATPLLKALKEDTRCKRITLFTDGVGHKVLKESGLLSEYVNIETPKESLYNRLGSLIDRDPVDLTVITLASRHGTDVPLLGSAKSVFQSKKLFLIFDGWTASPKGRIPQVASRDQVDGIFCNDPIARSIIASTYEGVEASRIFPTGTAQVDDVQYDKREEFIRGGMRKLDLKEGEIRFLYVGDISRGYAPLGISTDDQINEKSCIKTLRAFAKLASDNPSESYVFLVRPHPGDPDRDNLIKIAMNENLPSNLKVVKASRDIVTINEATYVANFIGSILSTETFKAPLRGITGFFLSYEENLGRNVIESLYPADLWQKVLSDCAGVEAVCTPERLTERLSALKGSAIAQPDTQSSSVERILSKIFS